ncbi:sigma-70 domain-containing protein, partial [Actinoplanes xinjiangensis]|uniref:sigma-70 domain-containing protein n=1 Tax=Actinoplanes xinjiangensis TaxID=512350 RepID=UPI00342F3EB8
MSVRDAMAVPRRTTSRCGPALPGSTTRPTRQVTPGRDDPLRQFAYSNRSPTVADIANHLDISEDEVIEGLEGARAYNASSLSTPVVEGQTELGETLASGNAKILVSGQLSLGSRTPEFLVCGQVISV